jgi:hypothetical protein
VLYPVGGIKMRKNFGNKYNSFSIEYLKHKKREGRNLKWQNPITSLMGPNTGSTVSLGCWLTSMMNGE